jgi:heme A synthase
MSFRNLSRFAKFAWFVLAWNLGVILFGAYVRASGSGAGCGSHWPLCNGMVIPRAARLDTLIEYTHRMTSGVALLLILIMLIWAWRIYQRGNSIRFSATLSMVFIITEALLGAGLVLFELVAENDSMARALSGSFHLVNTFLLLASISLTAWWASGGAPVQMRGKWLNAWPLAIGLLGVLILGMSGAVTALGDTLYPASSLAEGFQQDISPTAHFLIRLRVLHPTLAILIGSYLILVSGMFNLRSSDQKTRLLARILTVLIVMQLAAGVTNVFLLAPIWLQLVHLFLSDAVWIVLIFLSANVLSEPQIEVHANLPTPSAPIAKGDTIP